ncbi:Bicoid-interacting protein 3-domain-containing protein [Coprinopsis sp. MPI-PUGE-AT-0042]|nr:Bicoid-interacting protein 3-domain-containing protein [Coprinopsis sp. MPI-PUGE-AT-0042]
MSISVPIHGNYHGYYTKRPTGLSEPRLKRLPADLFRDAAVLDVGCNEGWVTCEIAQAWGAAKVVGVDIDDSLIQNAWKRRRTLWSLQEPLQDLEGPTNSDVPTGSKRKQPLDDEKIVSSIQPNYFPASFEHEFGPLPIPPHELRGKGGKKLFPHNVVFRTADWLEQDIVEDAEGYDVVLALSISKWIHLNAGDDGLKRFFTKVHRVLRKGGTFVLEPQPWDSYAKAKRMSEKLKESAKSLQLRPIGFGSVKHLGSGGEGGFDRPIDMYRKL